MIDLDNNAAAPIAYASLRGEVRRWSKMAIVALVASVGMPVLIMALTWAGSRDLIPAWITGNVAVAVMAAGVFGPLLCTLGTVVWLIAFPELKGMVLMIPAFIVSVGWPIWCFFYVLDHLPNC